MPAIVETLTYSERSKGWTSFWDYDPLFIFSLSGNFYSINETTLYLHYSGNSLRSNFYGVQYDSSVTLILNDEHSSSKSFMTLNYEGSNGWEAVDIKSDAKFPTSNEYGNTSLVDTARDIPSFSEGKFISNGVKRRHGFDVRNNKYYSALRNNSVINKEGEIKVGTFISGIKGFYIEVTFKTDDSTGIGGEKQLFSVGAKYEKNIT